MIKPSRHDLDPTPTITKLRLFLWLFAMLGVLFIGGCHAVAPHSLALSTICGVLGGLSMILAAMFYWVMR